MFWDNFFNDIRLRIMLLFIIALPNFNNIWISRDLIIIFYFGWIRFGSESGSGSEKFSKRIRISKNFLDPSNSCRKWYHNKEKNNKRRVYFKRKELHKWTLYNLFNFLLFYNKGFKLSQSVSSPLKCIDL